MDEEKSEDLTWLQSEYSCEKCQCSIVAVITDPEALETAPWIKMVLQFYNEHKKHGVEL